MTKNLCNDYTLIARHDSLVHPVHPVFLFCVHWPSNASLVLHRPPRECTLCAQRYSVCNSHYILSDECFSVEEIEETGEQAAVSLPEMRPHLFAQVQPDEALAPRVRRRTQISVRELQEAIQASASPAGPPEDPLRDLRLRAAQLKRHPRPDEMARLDLRNGPLVRFLVHSLVEYAYLFTGYYLLYSCTLVVIRSRIEDLSVILRAPRYQRNNYDE